LFGLQANGLIHSLCRRTHFYFWVCLPWRLGHPGCVISAQFQLGDASKVAPLDKLSLVLVAVFAGLFLGERLNSRECLGLALVVIGVVLLAMKR